MSSGRHHLSNDLSALTSGGVANAQHAAIVSNKPPTSATHMATEFKFVNETPSEEGEPELGIRDSKRDFKLNMDLLDSRNKKR